MTPKHNAIELFICNTKLITNPYPVFQVKNLLIQLYQQHFVDTNCIYINAQACARVWKLPPLSGSRPQSLKVA